MKRSLRFAALVSLLALTSWLSASSPARALDCSSVDQNRCTNVGEITDCYWTIAQEQIVCQCGSNHLWTCFY